MTAPIVGLRYLAFCAANTLVSWGRRLRGNATATFCLFHAAFAAGSGLCFVMFKLVASHHLRS